MNSAFAPQFSEHSRPSRTCAIAGTVRIGAILTLPELLSEMGVDPDATLAAAGLARCDFANVDMPISYQTLSTLFLECEQRTGCDFFGLRIGQRARLDDMGLAGRLARCEATAGRGLGEFIRNFNLHDSASIVTLLLSGHTARFVYAVHEAGLENTRHFQFGGIAIAYNIMVDLCGHGWRPTEVRFACRAPGKLRPFYEFFGAPLRFDAAEPALVFDRHWLERPLPEVDDAFRRELAAEKMALHAPAAEDLPTLVRGTIRKQLAHGTCSVGSVAEMLLMHRRTLDRRLARCGTSYRILQNSVKNGMARQLLRETRLPVQQIADVLQFSSSANFATAFRQWTGQTPSRFRRCGG